MKSLLKYGLAIALFSTTLPFGQAAFGQTTRSPESIKGTTWKGVADKEQVTVTINEQQPHNDTQITKCNYILGSMTPISSPNPKGEDSVTGFYCPETGIFAFSRLRNEDSALMQVYRGRLDGNSMKGNFLYMSGNWGEYPFSASKK